MSSKINLIPVGLLSAYVLKLLVKGADASEMGVVFALAGVVAAYEYLSKSRTIKDISEKQTSVEVSFDKKLAEQNAIIEKQNTVILALSKELADVRNSVASVKMAGGMNAIRKVGG